jgi:thiamine phosphate synthase YjbQ (UPF0047 family)
MYIGALRNLATAMLLVGRAPPVHRVRMMEPASSATLTPVALYKEVVLSSPASGPPRQEITVVDLMPHIRALLSVSGLREGTINVITRHTTCGITINEWESRLARDLRSWLLRLAPPDDRSEIGMGTGTRYEHNDIDQRPDSTDERERALRARSLVLLLARARDAMTRPFVVTPPYKWRSLSLCLPQVASKTDGTSMTPRSYSAGATRNRSMRTATSRQCSLAAVRPSRSRAASSSSASGRVSCSSTRTARESAKWAFKRSGSGCTGEE